jgi:hypothetical protein
MSANVGTRRVGEHQVDQRPALVVQRHERPSIGHGGIDLGPVSDDALVGEQPCDVAVAVGRDDVGLEAVERLAEAGPFAEDDQPREPGLEGLERQELEHRPLVAQGPAPLVVVVGDVERVAGAPAAAGLAVVAHPQVVAAGDIRHVPEANEGV